MNIYIRNLSFYVFSKGLPISYSRRLNLCIVLSTSSPGHPGLPTAPCMRVVRLLPVQLSVFDLFCFVFCLVCCCFVVVVLLLLFVCVFWGVGGWVGGAVAAVACLFVCLFIL